MDLSVPCVYRYPRFRRVTDRAWEAVLWAWEALVHQSTTLM